MKNNLLNYLKIILFTYLFSRVLNYIIAQFNFPDVPSHLAMVGFFMVFVLAALLIIVRSFLSYWKNERRKGG
ncbi:Uncharacterised protein [Mannheimia haemolytica]|uniref:Uncharacterized protein n=1 Tax=Mannheimia haemolytica TaxID=75985 RepID=A0A448TA79_MANHA|nr:Uncharacterised protein [Mannheimia haemolytica]VEI76881.1 Uncharacterised protein [Mannheimia haemolytica]